jgi:transposase-like protein
VKGEWRYLYRAVDKQGQTIDFLLTEHRDEEAALRFLRKAIRRHGVPEQIADPRKFESKRRCSYNKETTWDDVRYLYFCSSLLLETLICGPSNCTFPMTRSLL